VLTFSLYSVRMTKLSSVQLATKALIRMQFSYAFSSCPSVVEHLSICLLIFLLASEMRSHLSTLALPPAKSDGTLMVRHIFASLYHIFAPSFIIVAVSDVYHVLLIHLLVWFVGAGQFFEAVHEHIGGRSPKNGRVRHLVALPLVGTGKVRFVFVS
jgi:hypothetical protein